MTPTTPLAGVIYGLTAGLIVLLAVLLVLHNPWHREPARTPIPVQPFAADEDPPHAE